MEIVRKKAYFNYIALYDDGVIKIGTTSRPTLRLKEISVNPIGGTIKSAWVSRPSERTAAFDVERNTCHLLSYINRLPKTREWFATQRDVRYDLHTVHAAAGMYWCMKNSSSSGTGEFKEVRL